jgi:hypothetical protein
LLHLFLLFRGYLSARIALQVIARPTAQKRLEIGRAGQIPEETKNSTKLPMGVSGQSCREIAVDANGQWSDLAGIPGERLRPPLAKDFQQCALGLSLLLFYTWTRLCNGWSRRDLQWNRLLYLLGTLCWDD